MDSLTSKVHRVTKKEGKSFRVSKYNLNKKVQELSLPSSRKIFLLLSRENAQKNEQASWDAEAIFQNSRVCRSRIFLAKVLFNSLFNVNNISAISVFGRKMVGHGRFSSRAQQYECNRNKWPYCEFCRSSKRYPEFLIQHLKFIQNFLCTACWNKFYEPKYNKS